LSDLTTLVLEAFSHRAPKRRATDLTSNRDGFSKGSLKGFELCPLLLLLLVGALETPIQPRGLDQNSLELGSFWPQEGFEHSPITSTS